MMLFRQEEEELTLTLSAKFSSQSPSEKLLKSPVLLGLSGGLLVVVALCLGADGGTFGTALRAGPNGSFLGVRSGGHKKTHPCLVQLMCSCRWCTLLVASGRCVNVLSKEVIYSGSFLGVRSGSSR